MHAFPSLRGPRASNCIGKMKARERGCKGELMDKYPSGPMGNVTIYAHRFILSTWPFRRMRINGNQRCLHAKETQLQICRVSMALMQGFPQKHHSPSWWQEKKNNKTKHKPETRFWSSHPPKLQLGHEMPLHLRPAERVQREGPEEGGICSQGYQRCCCWWRWRILIEKLFSPGTQVNHYKSFWCVYVCMFACVWAHVQPHVEVRDWCRTFWQPPLPQSLPSFV